MAKAKQSCCNFHEVTLRQGLQYGYMEFHIPSHGCHWEHSGFVTMTTLLLQTASAVVIIIGQPSKNLSFKCGVRKGCPLAPYPFYLWVMS